MQVTNLIQDVVLFEPTVFSDDCSFFYESFNQKTFEDATGLKRNFIQDNHSRSVWNVLRGRSGNHRGSWYAPLLERFLM